jgi:hypothetical protein
VKFLTILYYPDGTVAGTSGSEYPLPDTWAPPPFILPGDSEPRRFLAQHLGAGEMPGDGRCVSELLAEAVETHPQSRAGALRFNVRPGKALPLIHDVPCSLSGLEGWLRANGPDRMAKPLRAWLTLCAPDFAEAHRLDRGVDLEDMIAVERKRAGVRPEHSRLVDLEQRIVSREQKKRDAVFARQAEATRARLEALRFEGDS